MPFVRDGWWALPQFGQAGKPEVIGLSIGCLRGKSSDPPHEENRPVHDRPANRRQ